jgi:hypothetical protein
VPVDSVSDDPGPHARWGVGVDTDGGCHIGDETDGALRDRIKVMVVRRARGVVNRLIWLQQGPKLAEHVRHELALAVSMDATHARPSERLALRVDGHAHRGVERGDAPQNGEADLRLTLDEVVEYESRVLVD